MIRALMPPFFAMLALAGCVGSLARSPYVLRSSNGFEVVETGPDVGRDRPEARAWLTYWSPEETAQRDAAHAAERHRKPAPTPAGGRLLITVECYDWHAVRALECIVLQGGDIIARLRPDMLDYDASKIDRRGRIDTSLHLDLAELPTAARPIAIEIVGGYPDGPWRFVLRPAAAVP